MTLALEVATELGASRMNALSFRRSMAILIATLFLTVAVAARAGGARANAHALVRTNHGVAAVSRALGARATFTDEGRVELAGDANAPWSAVLELRAVGRGSSSRPAPAVDAVVVDGSRVEWQRGTLTEWYVHDERGIEQGFTIEEPPEGDDGAPLMIEMALDGLSATMSEDGLGLRLVDDLGRDAVLVTDLLVVDAVGAVLPACFEASPRAVRIAIDDRDAAYPLTVDPLYSAATTTLHGLQAFASYGRAAATAGDVNGDGYSDVVIGAQLYDNGQNNEGRAVVHYGGPSGIATKPGWSFEINQADARFGCAVASAGDVNGDGYADVIVGAERWSGNRPYEGRAYVFLGGSAGLSANYAWSVTGGYQDAGLGVTVAGAGDVNADGFADVLVALRGTPASSDEGRVALYLGSATGLSTTPAWTATGGQPVARFGRALAGVGDVNGDRRADVVIGAYTWANGAVYEGRVLLYRGTSTGLESSASWTLEGDVAGTELGYAVGAAGDVNGDGYSDVLIGAVLVDLSDPNAPGASEGRAQLHLGSSSGLASIPAWSAEGNQNTALFGSSLATCGDANGDGLADVVVGAYSFSDPEFGEGKAFIYEGSPTGLGATAIEAFGTDQGGARVSVVSTAGDVDGDGFSDLLIGSESYTVDQANEGAVFVRRGMGAPPATAPAWHVDGDVAGTGPLDASGFGRCIALADVNGDAIDDVIVGRPGWNSDPGRAHAYHGSASGVAGTPAWTVTAAGANDWLGMSVASAGDVDGDGYDDVIVGCYICPSVGNGGRAFVYHGSPTGLEPSPAVVLAPPAQPGTTQFGYVVTSAGDVNGDGYGDVALGNGSHRGWVYLGSPTGIDPATVWAVELPAAAASTMENVAGVGDVDGDGYSDVLVSSFSASNPETWEGLVRLYLGSPSGLAAAPAWSWEPNEANASVGRTVAGTGDLDGDGFADFAITREKTPLTPTSSVHVFRGGPSGPGPTPSWTFTTTDPSSTFGYRITAGDFNGDSKSDLVIGELVGGSDGSAHVYLGSASGPSPTAAWTFVGPAGARFPSDLAAAGDVTGDGFPDLAGGAMWWSDDQSYEGRAMVFHGNDGGAPSRAPMQLRTDGSTRIAVLGHSDAPDRVTLRAKGRSPLGRMRVRLEWEVKALGTPFDGGSLGHGAWSDPGVGGVTLTSAATGLQPATPYRWRARICSDSPLYPHSPWFSLARNAPTATDFVTAP